MCVLMQLQSSALPALDVEPLGGISCCDKLGEQVPEVEHDGSVSVPLVLRDRQAMRAPLQDVRVQRLVVEMQVEGAHVLEDGGGIRPALPVAELPAGALHEDGSDAIPIGLALELT